MQRAPSGLQGSVREDPFSWLGDDSVYLEGY